MSYNDNTKKYQEDPLLYLNFFNHIIFVRCNESSLLKKIQEEFDFFVTDRASKITPTYTIEVNYQAPPEIPPMVAVKILEGAIVYRIGTTQYIDYGKALTIIHSSNKTLEIYSEDMNRLFELAFLSIHSIIGQELDKSGICRIHALAFSKGKTNAIVMLPSKGGKSTLLKNLIECSDFKIISDDMPLCDYSGKIFSFPSKISLENIPESGLLSNLNWVKFERSSYPPKWTASLSQLKDKISEKPELNKNLLIAGFRVSNGQSILTKVPKWKMVLPLMEHMIIGLGLPQIIEVFLSFRPSDFFKLVKHACLRSLCAFNLARTSDCYFFYMNKETVKNASLLLELMDEHRNS